MKRDFKHYLSLKRTFEKGLKYKFYKKNSSISYIKRRHFPANKLKYLVTM